MVFNTNYTALAYTLEYASHYSVEVPVEATALHRILNQAAIHALSRRNSQHLEVEGGVVSIQAWRLEKILYHFTAYLLQI
jgi:hypothetical protein